MVTQAEFLQGGGFKIVSDPTQEVKPEPVQSVSPETFLQTGGFTIVPKTPVEDDVSDPGILGQIGENIGQFGEDIVESFDTAGDNFARTRNDVFSGNISVQEGLIEVVADVGAETVFNVVGDFLNLAGRNIKAITPEEIADPVSDTAAKLAHSVLNTDLGQAGIEALQSGTEAWAEFEADFPRTARSLSNVIDIGLLLAPIPGTGAAKAGARRISEGLGRTARPTAAEQAGGDFILKTAGKLETAAEAQTLRQRLDFTEKLVRPEQTKKQLTEQALRTEEGGLLTTGKIEATEAERAIADTVADVTGVGPQNTMRTNAKIIQSENISEARALEKLLADKPIIVPKVEFAKALDAATARLAENPLLVGDAAKTAEKVIVKMKQLVNKNKSTVGGILKSRKELDAWVKSQKPKVFEGAGENALTTSVKEIRNTTNQFLDDIVPEGAVKSSLNKQFNLFRALDNMGPKVAAESTNKMVRLWQNVIKLTPFSTRFNAELAAGFGMFGLGTTLASITPAIGGLVAGSGALFLGGKAAMSATTKKALAGLLRKTDAALKVTKDVDLIRKIRADRAALVEILRDVEVVQE